MNTTSRPVLATATAEEISAIPVAPAMGIADQIIGKINLILEYNLMGLFDFLFGGDDSKDEDEENPITTSIDPSIWHPDSDERLLVMHEDCQILKNGGTSTASFQYLTYAVTTKRLVLIPQDCAPNRMVVTLIGKVLGLGLANSILVKEICDKRLNSPVSISRKQISSVEIGCEKVPSLRIATVVVDNQYLYIGMAKEDYTFDLQASIYNPDWF